jgi:hypothetical protein
MAWETVSASYTPAPGERVRITAAPYTLPTVDKARVQAALQAAGINVIEVNKSLFGDYEITLAAPGNQTMGDIGRAVAAAIDDLWDAWSTAVTKYERYTESFFSPPSTSTTISLVAFAVILALLAYVAWRLKLI